MGWVTQSRRRQIRAKGRAMQLMRPTGTPSVSVMAYAPPPQAVALETGAAVAPFVAQITNDELATATYGAPRTNDILMDGDRRYALKDAQPVYDGNTICGWALISSGGETNDISGGLG
ncbi:hypothetical protein [Acetobacter fabarum]|jgi:hypothetical protein|uniref:hypothetical protein n=1 Tax=Acetobacter fabarum TaxID=483199 RepID=UPI0026565153|nr:hypothetical protein [Acetobacter fabarum]MDN6714099.1 hypothetical protein [Acetobacter sp.]MCI1927841.1 hypothetical protein [Acetobacter fabarum]MCI1947858.1 hypothetical protein [Acetobacter fabarum]MCI1988849.1 hypothetical protein [Acetobacter fabarum]